MATEEELDPQAPADQQDGEPQVPGAIPVDLSDDDDDAPATPAEEAADKKSRRSWKREMRENLKREQQEKADLARQLNEMRAEMAGIRGAMAVRPEPQRQYQPDRPDPVEAELEGIQDQMRALLAQMNQEGLTEAKAEELQKKYWKLQGQGIRAAAKAAVSQVAPQQRDSGPEGLTLDQQNAMIEADFPEAMSSVSRQQECRLELVKLLEKSPGTRVTYALARKAAKIVHDKYSRRPAPSESDKAKHINTPGRAGASAANVTQLDPQTYKKALVNARGLYAHREDWSDERKVKEWMRKVGRKVGLAR